MRIRQVVWILPLFLATALPVLAQQGTSEIGGRVTDEQGAVLPGVSIVITNEETGVFREVTSGTDGSYFASQLIPGRYRIAAKLASFRTFERGGLQLAVGKTLTIDVTLMLGSLAETLTVTAESPLVDTTSIKVGGNIGTQELSELPAMNRNFFAAVALLPGYSVFAVQPDGQRHDRLRRQTSQNNNVAVDGGYNADDALGTSAGAQVRTPLEAIQEFQVLTSLYDAEFGRASGAIVNAVTKAGTNWVMENTGESVYNALNLSLEKRYANNWSGRLSYSLSKAVGTANDQNDKNTYQPMTNLNLDAFRGPSNVDRRHILSLGAQAQIPRTGGIMLSSTARYMSGAPFTIYDSSIDADRNGELIEGAGALPRHLQHHKPGELR
jgi:hypothetical protein